MKDTVVGRIEQLTGTAVTAAIGQAGRPGVELVDLAEISRLKARIAELEAALRTICHMRDEDNEWDAVDKYHQAREIASVNLATPFAELIGSSEETEGK